MDLRGFDQHGRLSVAQSHGGQIMLVLSRKLFESILIDDEIEIQVLRIEGGKVRLGFSAPRHVQIRRTELDNFEPVTAGCLDFGHK
jgi:carbon storage regulator CsrA